MAVSGNPRPVLVNHASKCLVRFQPLPLQRLLPVFKESSRPNLTLVVPQLTEQFLEHIGRIQALIGPQKFGQRTTAIQAEIGLVGKQGVFLTFDKLAVLAGEPGIFAFAHPVQSLPQMNDDMELVEQDADAGNLLQRGVTKGFPHVHDRQFNAQALFLSQRIEEQRQTRLRAIRAAKPDRSPPQQIAHHNPIGVPLADGNLINADHLGSGGARPPQLFAHILFLQFFDRSPMQVILAGHILDRRRPAPPPDQPGKTLGVKRIFRQPGQPLAFYLAAKPTGYPPHKQLQIEGVSATGQVADQARLLIVKTPAPKSTNATDCFFWRRRNVSNRTSGFPKTPRTVAAGTNPANR